MHAQVWHIPGKQNKGHVQVFLWSDKKGYNLCGIIKCDYVIQNIFTQETIN